MVTKTKQKLIDAALEVASQGLPVFPTGDKVPAWSNAELGVKKGEGGYKIATTDFERICELFAHGRAKEVAVPMGEMSGLMCIDVDLYKGKHVEEWYAKNAHYFKGARLHKTRSGGLHFFFKHPGNKIKFPATLIDGVDIKASGNGFVCWPDGINGYEVERVGKVRAFPMKLLSEAMKAKGGTGKVGTEAFRADSDDDLVGMIFEAEEIYPALRSLSYRLATRGLSKVDVVTCLQAVMDASKAADPSHPRHEDWEDRYGKIEDLVASAVEKHAHPEGEGAEMGELLAKASGGVKLIELSESTFTRLVEAAVPLKKEVPVPSGLTWFDSKLKASTILARPWLLGTRLLQGQFALLAGPGGTGKSSIVLATALALATGDEITGEKVHERCKTLIINNEDPRSEIERRLVAIRGELGLDGTLPMEHLAIQGAPENDGEETLILAVRDARSGEVEVVEAAFDWLEATIIEHDIKYCTLDPFISLIKGAVSNDNDAISAVAMRVRRIGFRTGCAIECVAHSKKPEGRDAETMAGDQSAVRGASALVDTARIVTTVMPMGRASAKELLGKKTSNGDLDEFRNRFLRMDTAKGNLSRKHVGRWYEMSSVDLGQGDEVGVPIYIGTFEQVLELVGEEVEEDMRAPMAAIAAIEVLGEGRHTLSSAFAKLQADDRWPWKSRGSDAYAKAYEVMGAPVVVESGRVWVDRAGKGKKTAWNITVEVKGKG